MKNLKNMLMLILPCFFLVSCIEMQEIEKIGIVNARGVDLIDDELFEVSFVMFQFTAESDNQTKIIKGKGKTVLEAVDDAAHASMYKLAIGKIKLSILGNDIVKKGILPLLDTASRDARIPDLMYLAVSKTTAEEVLSADSESIPTDIGQYLHGLIDNHSRDHNIPRKTLQDFLRIYYDVGQDNVLPIFEIIDDTPKLSSLAVFKADVMVGEITNNEATLINLMDRTVKEHELRLSLPMEPFKDHLEERENRKQEEEVQISVIIDNGKSKTTIEDVDSLIFKTDTTLKLRLLEQSAGIILKDPKVVRKMGEEIKKNMEARFKKILAKLQQLESDPFGFGLIYKETPEGKDLTNEEWREMYPTIKVNFNVEVEIIQHGVID